MSSSRAWPNLSLAISQREDSGNQKAHGNLLVDCYSSAGWIEAAATGVVVMVVGDRGDGGGTETFVYLVIIQFSLANSFFQLPDPTE